MEKKRKKPIDHINIAEFNHGQSSRIFHAVVEEDKTAFVQKNGKPIVVMMSYDRYQRLYQSGIDINEQ